MRLSLRRLDSVKGTLERNIIFKRFVLAQVNKCSEGFYGRRNESSTATRTGNIQVIVFVVKLIFFSIAATLGIQSCKLNVTIVSSCSLLFWYDNICLIHHPYLNKNGEEGENCERISRWILHVSEYSRTGLKFMRSWSLCVVSGIGGKSCIFRSFTRNYTKGKLKAG